MSQATSLAHIISRVDSEGKDAMRMLLEGKVLPDDFLPSFRRHVKRLLAGDKLKPTQRMALKNFASEYGLQTHGGDDPMTVVLRLRCSPGLLERVSLAAAGRDITESEWLRQAVVEKLMRDHG